MKEFSTRLNALARVRYEPSIKLRLDLVEHISCLAYFIILVFVIG